MIDHFAYSNLFIMIIRVRLSHFYCYALFFFTLMALDPGEDNHLSEMICLRKRHHILMRYLCTQESGCPFDWWYPVELLLLQWDAGNTFPRVLTQTPSEFMLNPSYFARFTTSSWLLRGKWTRRNGDSRPTFFQDESGVLAPIPLGPFMGRARR